MAEHHGPAHYTKIWLVLLVLLLVSAAGPEAGIQWVTLVTAFGIAVVKAYMVARNFMHINLQPAFISYIVGIGLLFMLLFYAGTAGDVMKQSGDNWVKPPVALEPPAPH